MVATGRCRIRVGDGSHLGDVRYRITHCLVDGKTISIAVAEFILRYLTETGVELSRTMPLGWFEWLPAADAIPSRFYAKCCDPADQFGDPSIPQPYDFYIVATLLDTADPLKGHGINFLHKTDPILIGWI